MITADIDTFKAKNLKAGKAEGTIQRAISQLRAIINFGVKRALCPPLQPGRLEIESIRVDGQRTEMLTKEQLSRLLGSLDAEPDQDAAALIRLAMGLLACVKEPSLHYGGMIVTLKKNYHIAWGVSQKEPLNTSQ